ncbi:MAG TPA: type II toxin-antitoxin system Phd/YefM family antitoxin [Allosphingosinicella sp.]|jgi:prevent-host-death family protein
MDSYSVADAKARFSEVIGKAEAGEAVEITRRGEAVVKVTAIEKTPRKVDVERLKRLTDSLPRQEKSAAELIREMRDSGY